LVGVKVPVDLLVVTPAMLADGADQPSSVIHAALKEGHWVHGSAA
jgi:hypothetical protein|tara:strand:- start:422 stop:556 length:135 start_codon:yes stop_codon:yes gene_type:complete